MTRPLISIVTPCYNEEANLAAHLDRVLKTIEPFRAKYDFEHLYTDNCSHDRTFELLGELARQHKNLRAVRFSRNIGATRAMLMGLEQAKGDVVVLIQADLQDPPEVIREFIEAWEQGYDVAYGQITQRREAFLMRSLRRLYYKVIATLSDVRIPENCGDFRLTSRRALNAMMSFQDDELYMRATISEVGFKQKAIPYVRQGRAAGRSSANLPYLLRFAMNALISTTIAPIRAVTIIGLMMAMLGFLMMVAFVVLRLFYPDLAPRGFTTLASLMTLFFGVQMLAIGVIGEYIRKIYVQTHSRPRGFIAEKIG